MTKETAITQLDYSKPPPGFEAARLPRALRMTIETAGVWGPNAIAAAWAICKVEYDPPGIMRCGPLALYVTYGPGLPQFMSRSEVWAWHDRRRALAIALDRNGWAGPGDPLDPWPHCLTWTDDQVAEVERWLRDSTAEMPEVLPQGTT